MLTAVHFVTVLSILLLHQYFFVDQKNTCETSVYFSQESMYQPIVVEKVLSERELIDGYINDISKSYGIDPELIHSIIWHESRYKPNEKTGIHIGLMQIGVKWHTKRIERLGVTDIYDPYSNILVGVDYISEMLNKYNDISLVLMLYNMDHKSAFALSKQGKISWYARSVLARANELKLEGN